MWPSRFTNPELARMLADPAWAPCERLIKAFEDAWRRGPAPTIGAFLQVDGQPRRALLIELVHLDLEFRLKAGEAVRVETYLAAYPELAGEREVAIGLIAAEIRGRSGGQVGADEYRRRFPEYASELVGQLPVEVWDTVGSPCATVRADWPTVPGYMIVAEIGRGGMGVVYKALEQRLGRYVALKFLAAEATRDSARLERFLHEARTASALNHPHICTVHALGEHDRHPFLVMEFIEGHTLQAVAARLPGVADAARLIGQAATALAAAHAAGVVHRDVKPENLMVRADGYVKVLDFGLARRLPTLVAPGPAGPDTDPGTLLGTVAYMSPEQSRGEMVEGPSDVFSLGIVFYQLITGQHPFAADSAFNMLLAITTRHPVPPSRLNPEVPAALDHLIEAMLHKQPHLRPSAAEVAATLAGEIAWAPATPPPARPIVHRETELAALRAALAEAEAGRGALVCVAGEPGIGKTTLVEDFLSAPGSDAPLVVARGHCSERLAGTEAYLPVLDAVADLLRGAAKSRIVHLMKAVAPTWWAQVAGANAPAPANSQQAMLREFGELLREAGRRATVVLFFDDIHWADVSTVDLLAHVGRHFRELRVLVVVTYRPTELLLGPHPFQRVKLELQGRGVCTELALGFLSRADVDHYLTLAFPGHALPADFAALVHARTEGSPLFLADLLRYLRERGIIAEVHGRWSLARELPDLRREMPESVRSMIKRKLDRLGADDHRLLAAASVQGREFESAVVAGALPLDAAEVEERLQRLDRVHGLVRLVRVHEFPDRTLTIRYAFVHVLYQHALDTEISPTRRAALGAALGRLLEEHHGAGAANVAAELAYLYEVGRDFGRAARHFWQAAQNAVRVFAHREAVVLARRGLRQLDSLPPTPERAALELPLQIALGLQLQVTDGFAAAEAGHAYARARELCRQTADSRALLHVLWGLCLYSKVRSKLSEASALATEMLALAQNLNDPTPALQAQQVLAVTTLCLGKPSDTVRHMEQTVALYDAERHRTYSFVFGHDPAVSCKSFGAVALWLLGFPDAAWRHNGEAIRLSHELARPSDQTRALHFAAVVHQLRGEAPQTRALAELCGTIAVEHGFAFWQAAANVMSGWALARSGAAAVGIDRLRQGLRDWAATDSVTYQTYYLGLLAETLMQDGQWEEADRLLQQALALARQVEEALYEAELHRLRGELHLGRAQPAQAAVHYRMAMDVARRQAALALELRAALSLARLGLHNAEAGTTRAVLADIYGRFTEGMQTPDLQEAVRLLHGPEK
jgi:predicted ATPase